MGELWHQELMFSNALPLLRSHCHILSMSQMRNYEDSDLKYRKYHVHLSLPSGTYFFTLLILGEVVLKPSSCLHVQQPLNKHLVT